MAAPRALHADGAPRVAVIIPCFNDGEFLAEAVHSVAEEEGIEVVVVDDASTDAATRAALDELQAEGVRVIRQAQNAGVSAARMAGLRASSAPYVFPLDADDRAIPGALSAMADMLDADPAVGVCFGDYLELGEDLLVRGVPQRLDGYRLAYTNEYPASAMFRRAVLDSVGGWQPVLEGGLDVRSDWSLWMSLAEAGVKGRHAGRNVLTYLRRVHAGRLGSTGRSRHREVYRALRRRHPDLYSRLGELRRQSDLGHLRRLLYPVVYGARPRFRFEPSVKLAMDRLGIWTLQRPLAAADRLKLREVTAARPAAFTPEASELPGPEAGSEHPDARIAVVIPCYNDGQLAVQALRSIDEAEPLEVVIVDDASTDPDTVEALDRLAAEGAARVLRHRWNGGQAAARLTGLKTTTAPYVFPLDADDLAMPGALALMADRLDRDPAAVACFGDYEEFGTSEILRAVPDRLDPYRLAYTNEYPVSALFRRRALEGAGGWSPVEGYEDWDLWMTLAEGGAVGVHAGPGIATYRRRLHGERSLTVHRERHPAIYRQLQARHPILFSQLRTYRRASDLNPIRKVLYPVIYGGRRRFWFEPRVKRVFDRLGVWTLRR